MAMVPSTLSSAVNVPVLSKQQMVTNPIWYSPLFGDKILIVAKMQWMVIFKDNCIGNSGGITFVTITIQCKNSFHRLP